MVYWVWLTEIKGIGPVTAQKLLDLYENPQNIFENISGILLENHGLTKTQKGQLDNSRSLDHAKRIIDSCFENNISILPFCSLDYPYRAKCFADAPIVLYYKGNIRKIEHSVGIVGARRCTQNDKQNVIDLVGEYLKKDYTIVSGMAKGVDSYAHTTCINNGGYTVAVLGNGLDICYPSEHINLMKKIEETGLLISEYPPGTAPTRFTFPKRNRLIAAWSDEINIIGAGKGSGAFITADWAKKYDRPWVVVPSN